MDDVFGSPSRPAWLDAMIAVATTFAGQLIVLVGLAGPLSGTGQAVLLFLAAAAVGLAVGVLVPRGPAVGTVAVGIVLAFVVWPVVVPGSASMDIVAVALAAVAGAFGFAVA